MKKIIFFVIIFFLLNFSNVFGMDYFSDDFNTKDNTKWNYIQNENDLIYSDGYVDLGSEDYLSYLYPFFINKNNFFKNNKDWILDIKFKYRSTHTSGDGIGIGFTNTNGDLFYQFGIWNDASKYLFFYYNDFSSRTNGCENFNSISDMDGRVYVGLSLADDNWHNFRVQKNGTKYSVYIDEKNIYNTSENQCIPTNLWFGNKLTTGLGYWSSLSIDDVKVYDNIPVKKPKIIFLPGLGASWNTDAVVYNKTVDADQWKMTPFVKNYKGLINALKQNGLEENTDFYVWNYDWRRPANEIVTNLNSFINQKISEDEKVILIGHSLGGLVSRIWAEDNKNDSRLEKVIDLASPNLGSTDTYEIWNGGQVSDLTKISSIAFKILLKIQGVNTKTDMEAVRKYFPIVRDLLPTFNFISKNGSALTNDKLETKNNYLSNKNNIVDIGTTLKLFVGNGFKTTDSINLKNNNVFDKALGIWPDGRINKNTYSTDGDGTVLTKSANYEKTDFIKVNSKHGEIIDKTINQVMIEIGLSQVSVIGETQDLNNSLVVFVGSPVNYSVKCDNESPVSDDNGFVVIKNNNYKSCNINLVGIGNGLIHVVTGNTNDSDWSYWEKNIVKDEINNIKINPTNGQIINDKDNVSFLKSIIKADINSLLTSNKDNKFLKEALKNLDKNQPKILIVNIFGFRNGNNERILSEKIIDNATIWLSLINKCSKNEANSGFKIISGYQNLINNLISVKNKKGSKISENAAISYQKMDKILESNQNKINQKDYLEVCANNFAALSYGSEVLVKAYNKNDFKMWIKNDL